MYKFFYLLGKLFVTAALIVEPFEDTDELEGSLGVALAAVAKVLEEIFVVCVEALEEFDAYLFVTF